MTSADSGFLDLADLPEEPVRRYISFYTAATRFRQEKIGTHPSDAESYLLGGDYIRLASYLALTDPRSAKASYARAAEIYRRLRSPYCLILAICSHDQETIRRVIETDFQTASGDRIDAIVFGSLARLRLSAQNSNRDARLEQVYRDWRRQYRDYAVEGSVGRLKLSPGLYAELLGRLADDNLDSPFGEMTYREYLRQVEAVMRLVRSDHYHWQSLNSGLFPVEPEVLAVCLTARYRWSMVDRDEPRDLAFWVSPVGSLPDILASTFVRSGLEKPDEGSA
jgi:hypothetical protein